MPCLVQADVSEAEHSLWIVSLQSWGGGGGQMTFDPRFTICLQNQLTCLDPAPDGVSESPVIGCSISFLLEAGEKSCPERGLDFS